MDFLSLVKKNRSYRRFKQDHRLNMKTLRELVNLARLSGSSSNLQGLKFFLSVDSEMNSRIFKYLKWAYYLKNWDGPAEGERPGGYIIILGDTEIHSTIDTDVGIAAQSILLGAAEKGLGGCMIGSVDRPGLRKELNIKEQYQIPLVIALGKPDEKIVLDKVEDTGNIQYWRDENDVHHVPKRSLDDIII
ncbi:MAG: nitroreductase family protein [Bacteroidales bacterium]|nr:MAG: nitroreductase family protein [Bacteroidales bacterium]